MTGEEAVPGPTVEVGSLSLFSRSVGADHNSHIFPQPLTRLFEKRRLSLDSNGTHILTPD